MKAFGREKTARRNMGREWLGESWFKLKSVAEEEPEELAAGRDIARCEMVAEEVDMSEQLQDLDSTAQMERHVGAPPPLHVEEGDEVGGVQVIEMSAKPDAKTVEEHEMHHANFEPWCPPCVAGQGRDHPHRRSKHEPKERIIYSDYMFFTKKGESVKKADGEKQKGLITVLTGICKSSQYLFAVVVPHKCNGAMGGKTTTSDEHLVMTEVGTQTYRTVRRLPRDSQHQDYILNVVEECLGTQFWVSQRAGQKP